MIQINLDKALEIHKEQIRKKRNELFPILDVQFMKALEQGKSELAASIGAQKQSLRDITDIDITNVTSLGELKLMWDEELLGESPYK
jgi:hypothetical protein